MAKPPTRCNKLLGPQDIILKVYEYRKSSMAEHEVLEAISCSLASLSNEIDVSRISLTTLTVNRLIDFHDLIKSLNTFYKKPTPETLKNAVLALGGQLRLTCTRMQKLDNELKRLDKRMKLYGTLLGATFPVLFIISMYSNLLLGVLVIITAISLWYLIRKDGTRYKYLSIEKAWTECLMTKETLKRLLSGKTPIPSLFEIFGVPPPRID